MAELDIPESWCKTELGKIFTIIGGTTPKANVISNFCDEGGKPWVTPADFSGLKGSFISRGRRNVTPEGEKSCSLRMLPAGSILYSSRAPIGHCAIASNPIFTNQGFKSLSFNPLVDSIFTLHFMRFITPFIEGLATGTTFKEVSGTVISKVPFLLPPLAEQKRIVAKIESSTAKIDAIEKAVTEAEALLEKYRDSLLAKAFRGELVPQDPNDEPASKVLERIRAERAKQQTGKGKKANELQPISEDEIPFEIPKSWEWVRLGEIVDFQGGSQPPKSNFRQDPHKDYVRLVQIRDFKSDANAVYIPKNLARRSFTKSDIMIGRYGPPVFQILRGLEGSYNVALMKAVPSGAFNQEYLFWFLQDTRIQSDVIKKSERSAGQTGVNLEFLNQYIVPLPPIAEQQRIISSVLSKLTTFSGYEKIIEDTNRNISRARRSILSCAFSGRLVPQDSSEGTGHALLAEIVRLNQSEPENKSLGKKTRTPKVRS